MVTDIQKKFIYADCLNQIEIDILAKIERTEIHLKAVNKAFTEAKDYNEKDIIEKDQSATIQTIKAYKSIINYLANMSI